MVIGEKRRGDIQNLIEEWRETFDDIWLTHDEVFKFCSYRGLGRVDLVERLRRAGIIQKRYHEDAEAEYRINTNLEIIEHLVKKKGLKWK